MEAKIRQKEAEIDQIKARTHFSESSSAMNEGAASRVVAPYA